MFFIVLFEVLVVEMVDLFFNWLLVVLVIVDLFLGGLWLFIVEIFEEILLFDLVVLDVWFKVVLGVVVINIVRLFLMDIVCEIDFIIK